VFCYSVLEQDSSNEEEGKEGDTFTTGKNSVFCSESSYAVPACPSGKRGL
jgi:hypothetical protein